MGPNALARSLQRDKALILAHQLSRATNATGLGIPLDLPEWYPASGITRRPGRQRSRVR